MLIVLIVGGMFMLVGAEKKIMGWRNDILGPGKKRRLTPVMAITLFREEYMKWQATRRQLYSEMRNCKFSPQLDETSLPFKGSFLMSYN